MQVAFCQMALEGLLRRKRRCQGVFVDRVFFKDKSQSVAATLWEGEAKIFGQGRRVDNLWYMLRSITFACKA